MATVASYIQEARAAIEAGDLDKAEDLKRKAQAVKALDDLEAEAIKAAPEVKRLPFAEQGVAPQQEGDATKAAIAWAAKAATQTKFDQPDAAFKQISRELYGDVVRDGDYQTVAAMKKLDFNRFLKTNMQDPVLSRRVLLSPHQIALAIMEGVSISEIKATMVEAQDTLGGYLVPEDFRLDIISRLPGLTVVRPLATVVQTSRDVVSFVRRTGGTGRYIGAVRVTKANETPANAIATATNATYGKASIPIYTLMGNVAVSRSLLEDSAANLAAELTSEFSTAIAIYEDEQYLVGNGIDGPLGILKDATTGGPSSSDTQIVNGGAASSLTSADGIVAMPYKLDGQYRQAGAVYAMNKATRETLVKLKDGSGRYLFGDNNNMLVGDPGDKLRGYSIKESEAMSSIAANYYPIIFGDMKGYRIADRVGMAVERYLDSTTAANDTVSYFVRWRGGGQVTHGERFSVLKIAV